MKSNADCSYHHPHSIPQIPSCFTTLPISLLSSSYVKSSEREKDTIESVEITMKFVSIPKHFFCVFRECKQRAVKHCDDDDDCSAYSHS